MFRTRMVRSFIILVVALGLTTTAFALAAGNTVDTSKAGDGDAAISGYTVTGITYNLNNADIDSVVFTLDAAATNVAASVSDSTGTETYATTCTTGGSNQWTCTFPAGTTVADAFFLRVIAAQ